MTYYVKCPNYKSCAHTALAFGKAYGATNLNSQQPKVTAGEHTFIFVYDRKKYKDEISLDSFLNKYFKEAK